MTFLIQTILSGVALGLAYAILALSINIIYSTFNILNFAQGELMMLGGMLGWVFYSQLNLPYPLALIAVMGGCAGVGILEWAMTVWPLSRRHATLISIVIATLGFSIVIRIAVLLTMGGVERFARPPLGSSTVEIGGIHLVSQDFVIVLATVLLLLATWWVYTRSSLGLALRAAAINPEASRLVGINVSRLTMVVFGLGAATAGLAGFLLSPLAYASPSIGLDFAILGFTAAVIGGLGSWPGAVVGGLVLGVIEALAFRYVSSQWGDFLTFALMLTILYIRPTGLFRELGASSA